MEQQTKYLYTGPYELAGAVAKEVCAQVDALMEHRRRAQAPSNVPKEGHWCQVPVLLKDSELESSNEFPPSINEAIKVAVNTIGWSGWVGSKMAKLHQWPQGNFGVVEHAVANKDESVCIRASIERKALEYPLSEKRCLLTIDWIILP